SFSSRSMDVQNNILTPRIACLNMRQSASPFTTPAWTPNPGKPDNRRDEMDDENEQIAHNSSYSSRNPANSVAKFGIRHGHVAAMVGDELLMMLNTAKNYSSSASVSKLPGRSPRTNAAPQPPSVSLGRSADVPAVGVEIEGISLREFSKKQQQKGC